MSEVVGQRFVILEHDHPFLHWDLMIEQAGALKTWRLLEQPVPGKWLAAEGLPDHRTAYLSYEGEVSGNRGMVKRLTSGLCVRHPEELGGVATDFSESQSEVSFQLFDCPFAVRASLRTNEFNSPQWRFQ